MALTDGSVRVNPTGNPGMATGGTGDVLTGLIAGLLAQGMDALDAAVLGVYLHGLAGDLAASRLGEMALAANDLIEILPATLAELKGGEDHHHDHEHDHDHPQDRGPRRGHGRHPHRR